MSKWEKLNVYLPPTVDPNETQKRSEYDLIFTYLGALDNTYETIRSQILASVEMPDFDSMVAQIQQEKSRQALMNPQTPIDTEIAPSEPHFPTLIRQPRRRGPQPTTSATTISEQGTNQMVAGSSIRISGHREPGWSVEVLGEGEATLGSSVG
jgi:hypothetical protein